MYGYLDTVDWVILPYTRCTLFIFHLIKNFPFGKIALVEKWTSIPVPEGHLYRKSNRYKRFGTKAPPSLVPVPYKPVLKGPPRWLPGESRARDLWYRFVTRTGTKGIQGLGF
jgi:hypothetical protein